MFKKVHRNELNIRLGPLSKQIPNPPHKFLIVSLCINLIPCFKENLFIVAYIFLIVTI